MSLSSIVPKPAEYGGSDSATVEGTPEMSETHSKAVVAYPAAAAQVNSQSFLQLAMYPITLKVGFSLSLSLFVDLIISL